MSYPTKRFKTIFEDVVRATGRPESVIGSLSTDDQERVVELINAALFEFWDTGFWPGTFAIEQRTIDATDKYILKAAAGETEIGAIEPEECFYADEPLPRSLKDVLGAVEDRGDRIVCFDEDCPAQPYIRFQKPCPEFTRAVHSDDTTYGLGDLAYDATTGECYKSLQTGNTANAVTDTDWWERVAFPKLAATFVKWSASSEWLAEDDGKYQQAARARRELERLEDVHLPVLPVGR